MAEMKEKNVYPTLPTIREAPTAPDISSRLKVILDVQKFFEEEINKRDAFSKKYFRVAKIINITDNVLIGITVLAEAAGVVLLSFY